MTLEHRRDRFLELISAHSEDRYAAGWMRDIEQEIRAQGGLWIALAAACHGWPNGYRAEHGWSPLTPDEFRQLDDMLDLEPCEVPL